MTLIDMLAGGEVATTSGCAEPTHYVREPDTTCEVLCVDGVGLIEGSEIGEPTEAIPDVDPRRSEGCGGGAASGLGLVVLVMLRRRMSTR